MSTSGSNLLDVHSPRKPSETKSVDSGYCGPSREPSTSLLRTNSSLQIIGEKTGGISKEPLSSSRLMSSSFASIVEDDHEADLVVKSESPRLKFVNVPDYHRVASTEASQPSVMHFNESHLPFSLTFSSSGSSSQRSILQCQIRVTSSGESQSKCNKPAAKSTYSTSLTAEQEGILRRTVVKKTHLFTEHTNFVTLQPYLFEKRLLHTGECEKLGTLSSNKEKGNHFYTVILPQKGERAYRRLYRCLKKETEHLGHGDLVEILDKALEEQQSPQSSSDNSPTTDDNSDQAENEGTSHRLGDSSNLGSPPTSKPDMNSPPADDTLITDGQHNPSCKYSGGNQVHAVHPPPCIHSHPSDGGDEGKSDPVSTEDPPCQSSHKAANRNGRTGGCCIIL